MPGKGKGVKPWKFGDKGPTGSATRRAIIGPWSGVAGTVTDAGGGPIARCLTGSSRSGRTAVWVVSAGPRRSRSRRSRYDPAQGRRRGTPRQAEEAESAERSGDAGRRSGRGAPRQAAQTQAGEPDLTFFGKTNRPANPLWAGRSDRGAFIGETEAKGV